jgi:hypothetical protein
MRTGNKDSLVGLAVMALIGLAWWTPGVARACGGFFTETTEETELVDTNDQRILYVIDGTTVAQHVQVAYTGQVERIAWVYPVAGNPTVTEGRASVFDEADELTRPRFTITTFHEGDGGGGGGDGCGCFGMASDSAAPGDWSDEEQVEDVHVWSSGQVGLFDYVVLSAESVDPLTEWLSTNGFAIPEEAGPVMAHYVAADWFFVAMRISADEASSAEASTSTVVFTYESETPMFPLHMASLSSADSVGVLVYVISDRAYETEGLPSRRLDTSLLHATSSSTTNYDSVFGEAVNRDDERGLAIEAVMNAGELTSAVGWEGDGSPVITRLRTVLDVADMTTDVTLVAAASLTMHEPVYSLSYDGEASARPPRRPGVALAGLTLVVFFTFRRLRRPS